MKTLTTAEWEMVFALPADGRDYHIDGVAIRAKHIPATKLKVEHVMVDSGKYGVLRRLSKNGKWMPTDHVGSY